MKKKALSIAGLDPCNGAGLTADLKTFEAHGIMGLSVCTAITAQNENEFDTLEWVKRDLILKQLDVLLRKYTVEVVKIGIVENLDILHSIIQSIQQFAPDLPIVWDPILKASAGYQFHQAIDQQLLIKIAKSCFLITPNQMEWEALFAKKNHTTDVTAMTNILLKGGHNEGDYSIDILIENQGKTAFQNKRLPYTKHGTGCVLSAAIAANIAKGYPLKDACKAGKLYTHRFINSNKTLLGDHRYYND